MSRFFKQIQRIAIHSLLPILIGLLFVTAITYAVWQEPSQAPPGCASGDPGCAAPLDVSDTNQSKEGWLTIGDITAPSTTLHVLGSGTPGDGMILTESGAFLNYGGAPYGLIVQYGDVGIGTPVPGKKLDIVGGEIRSNTGFCIGDDISEDCIASWSEGGENYWVQSGSDLYASNTSWNVGIGTTDPDAKLTVENGAILASGVIGGIPVSGAGTRLMWIPEKKAFRAGSVDGTQWDVIGNYSTAIGNNVIASEPYSFAQGLNAEATGLFAVAMGSSTEASGMNSTAIGDGAIASGTASIALGFQTTASEIFSTALGFQTTASGVSSVALGDNATATGNYSTAIGQNVQALADNSFVIGRDFTNSIANTFAIGFEAPDTDPSLFVRKIGGEAAYYSGVGIRTNNPFATLHVDGSVIVGPIPNATSIAGGDFTVADILWLIESNPNGGYAKRIYAFDGLRTDGDIIVETGYIQFYTISGTAPPSADCDTVKEAGRTIVRTDGAINLYICSGVGGWIGK